jgi:hypothetical protein
MERSHRGKKSPERLKPCMPPLMEDETISPFTKDGGTSYGGTACENLVKAYFLAQLTNIAEPHVDNGVDLLIEKPEGWVRGQVKKVVYQLHLDWGMKERSGTEVYRSRFNFNFQGGGKNASHLKNGRKQRSLEEIDYFYHVLLTPHRQLIWETPANLIPLREDKCFIHGKDVCLDRDSWMRKRADIDFGKFLIYSRYDPIIFKTYPEFFIEEEKTTLDEFFDYE